MATPAVLINQQLLEQGKAIDQSIIDQGLLSFEVEPLESLQAPSLFDQVQTGLFSTGNPLAAAELSEKLTGPFAGGIFGKKAARARTEFVRDQQEAGRSALLQQQESIGLEMTPERIETMDQFIDSPLGLAGASQFLAQEQQQEQFDLPLAVAGRERTAQAITNEEQKRLAAVGRQMDDDARVELSLRKEEADFRRLDNEREYTQELRTRERALAEVTSRDQFRTHIASNKALFKASQSLIAGSQSIQLLDQIEAEGPDSRAAGLMLATLAVTATIGLEPGLATREDDQKRFNTPLLSGWEVIGNQLSLFNSGRIDASEAVPVIRTMLAQIMQPQANRAREMIGRFQEEGQTRFGFQPGDVLQAAGFSEQMVQELDFWDPAPVDPSTRPAPPTGLSVVTAADTPPPTGVRRIQIRDQ